MNIFELTDTYTLLEAVERIDKPKSYLVDTFFPNKTFYDTTRIGLEYRKAGRNLAPAITEGGGGRNISRGSAQAKFYDSILYGPKRTIGLKDLELRQFGERPDIYRVTRPEDRLAKMQAEDLNDLLNLHANRKEQMASEILQKGKFRLKAYADDGKVAEVIDVDYQLDCEVYPATSWADPDANIYDDLMTISMEIQEETGTIPALMICGKGVERQLLNNKEIREWLTIPNRENLTMAGFAPRFTAPNARYIGNISALNLEVISYLDTYIDDDGKVHPYIDDNTAIFGNPGQGRQLYGTVTLFMPEGIQTFSAEYIPKYDYSDKDQQYSLTVYSRYALAPNVFGDWKCIRTLGE